MEGHGRKRRFAEDKKMATLKLVVLPSNIYKFKEDDIPQQLPKLTKLDHVRKSPQLQ